MAGKKTGLFLTPMSEKVVNEVAKKYGYTKISNIVNFIILEYDKLINGEKVTVQKEVKAEETKPQVVAKNAITEKKSYNEWFVVEEKKQ